MNPEGGIYSKIEGLINKFYKEFFLFSDSEPFHQNFGMGCC